MEWPSRPFHRSRPRATVPHFVFSGRDYPMVIRGWFLHGISGVAQGNLLAALVQIECDE
jgi:hypothetical protein